MSQPTKPIKSDKGLQEPNLRDGTIHPVFLEPLLQRPDLDRFEPTPVQRKKIKEPGKQWISAIDGLRERTVGLSDYVVNMRESAMVEWTQVRPIALFRFRCGMSFIKREFL